MNLRSQATKHFYQKYCLMADLVRVVDYALWPFQSTFCRFILKNIFFIENIFLRKALII